MSSTTHSRILEAAYGLLVETGDPTVSMSRIAEEAGVSRQAVYLHFESRTALLLELVRWVDEGSGLGDRMRAAEAEPDPLDRARAVARESARYEAEIRDIARALDAARYRDDAAAAAWDDRMTQRRAHLTRIFGQVAEAGGLRGRWTPSRAAEAFWAMTTPGAYRALVDECRWEQTEYEDWVVELLERVFLNPAR
jgi:AcrR family transcriptional regulator